MATQAGRQESTRNQIQPASGRFQWLGGYAAGVAVVCVLVAGGWALTRGGNAKGESAAPATTATTPAAGVPIAEVNAADLDRRIAAAPRISAEALRDEMEKGEVAVVDVRDQRDFAAGHIPGSLQIPLTFVEGEIPWLPRDKKIVTYCACPAEETSGRAVVILQNGGLNNVAALQGGIDHWRAIGLPIETGLPKQQ